MPQSSLDRVLRVPDFDGLAIIWFALALVAIPALWWTRSAWSRAAAWTGLPTPWTFGITVAIFAVALFIPAIGLSAADAVLAPWGGGTAPHADEIRAGAAVTVQLVALWWVWRRSLLIQVPTQGSPRGPLAAVAVGAAGMALCWPIFQTAGAVGTVLQQWMTNEPPPALGHDELQRMMEAPKDGWFALSAAVALIGAPLAEEVLWRGLCQQAFRRAGIGAWWSIVITAWLFAATHLPVLVVGGEAGGLTVLFGLGVLFGVLAERSGGIVAPFTAHALFNAANLIIAMTVTAHEATAAAAEVVAATATLAPP